MPKEALITHVVQDSIADEMGVEPGDKLVKINGKALEDLIDYQFLTADDELEIELIKADGEVWVLEVEKDLNEDLGLEFAQSTFDGIKRCGNKCVFCFVEQMPPGLRDTLYVKDDDYRMSFLHGNFITCTNLSEDNLQRIINLRLSPLYVSVHTTNPELRQKMLNSPRAGEILQQLVKLADAGLELHCQIVTCPGINDGVELERTISELGKLYPSVQSIAAVPVGLTAYRQDLFPLRLFNKQEAAQLIKQIDTFQRKFRTEYHRNLVYAADEFYMIAAEDIPETAYYEDFPQTENGVGLVRLFLDDFQSAKAELPQHLPQRTKLLLVTGKSAETILQKVASDLNNVGNLEVTVAAVPNTFFGETVSVAGLVTGRDILNNLSNKRVLDQETIVCIPSVMLKSDENIFLDGTKLDYLAEQLGVRLAVIDMDQLATDLVSLIVDKDKDTANEVKNPCQSQL